MISFVDERIEVISIFSWSSSVELWNVWGLRPKGDTERPTHTYYLRVEVNFETPVILATYNFNLYRDHNDHRNFAHLYFLKTSSCMWPTLNFLTWTPIIIPRYVRWVKMRPRIATTSIQWSLKFHSSGQIYAVKNPFTAIMIISNDATTDEVPSMALGKVLMYSDTIPHPFSTRSFQFWRFHANPSP